MANYGGSNFTTFSGVNLKNTAAIRFAAGNGGFESTLSIAADLESARAWRLPAKSGTLPVTGTFAVNLPAISASSYTETMVTVSGLRREDSFMAVIRDMFATTATGSSKTYPFLAGCRPENGYVYLTFYNPTTTATIYGDIVLTYTTAR